MREESRKEWKTLRNEVADIRSVADAVELLHDFTQRQPEFTYLLKCCLLGVFLSKTNFFAFVSIHELSYLYLLPLATLGFVVFLSYAWLSGRYQRQSRKAFFRKYLTVNPFNRQESKERVNIAWGCVFLFTVCCVVEAGKLIVFSQFRSFYDSYFGCLAFPPLDSCELAFAAPFHCLPSSLRMVTRCIFTGIWRSCLLLVR